MYDQWPFRIYNVTGTKTNFNYRNSVSKVSARFRLTVTYLMVSYGQLFKISGWDSSHQQFYTSDLNSSLCHLRLKDPKRKEYAEYAVDCTCTYPIQMTDFEQSQYTYNNVISVSRFDRGAVKVTMENCALLCIHCKELFF